MTLHYTTGTVTAARGFETSTRAFCTRVGTMGVSGRQVDLVVTADAARVTCKRCLKRMAAEILPTPARPARDAMGRFL